MGILAQVLLHGLLTSAGSSDPDPSRVKTEVTPPATNPAPPLQSKDVTLSALQELLVPVAEEEMTSRRAAKVRIWNQQLPTKEKIATQWWDPTFTNAPIYITPTWGLSNRLRTMAGAFIAGRAVRRNVIVVWRTVDQCPQKLEDLFIGVAAANSVPKENVKNLDHWNKCEYRPANMSEIEATPHNISMHMWGCDFEVKSTVHERHLAFHAMHLQPKIQEQIRGIINSLMIEGRHTVGIHIRQGSLQDAKEGTFFAKMPKAPKDANDIPCCMEDLRGTNRTTWICNSNTRPLGNYLQTMQQNFYKKNAVFFIAADRPQCLESLKAGPAGQFIYHSDLLGANASRNNATAAVVDMYVLAALDEFVAGDPGSWSKLIDHMRKGFQQIIR